jgi:lipid A ethanolaminephosphotransferase
MRAAKKSGLYSLWLFVGIAGLWMAVGNFSFYKALTDIYPPDSDNLLFLFSISFTFTAMIAILLALVCFKPTTKPILITLLIISSLAAYFMDTYNVVIDASMIQNVFETNPQEAADLISPTLFLYVIFFGLAPAWGVARLNIRYQPLLREVAARIVFIVAALATSLALLFSQSATSASFFREHKSVRYYSNPGNYIFGLGKLARNAMRTLQSETPLAEIGADAKIPETDVGRELVIVVVGETARADRFSLNGYARITNPLLQTQNVVSFTNVTSCGTLTAISVPCMFAAEKAGDFDVGEAKTTENALDVLKHARVQVLWRDNNSSSKGVADRVDYQDFRNPDNNPVCDIECRDVGMLAGLQDYVDAQEAGDIVIVLHQMGNHGPAYYKRYPKAFEKFTPACQTNELANCSLDEVNNAYDNAILYTDYFLNEVITFLKTNDDRFETAMLYISDHGESLGEAGLFLHGMPNFVAPDEQRKVPLILWAGRHYQDLGIANLRANRDQAITHDNIFHAILGLVEVGSEVYDPTLDFLRHTQAAH